MSGRSRIPDADAPTIIARYKAGENTIEIGKTYDLSRDAIRAFLMKHGVRTNQKGGCKPTDPKKVAKILEAYQSGLGAKRTATLFGVDKKTVFNLLQANGVSTRKGAHFRLPVDEHVFDKLTEESLYWLGFLMADGCVSISKAGGYTQKCVIVCLAVKDRAHLEKFKAFMKSGHAIRTRWTRNKSGKWTESARISITSAYLADQLTSFGITPAKSKTCKASTELATNRHFWRGVVDGDGCIHRWDPSTRLIPSFDVLGSRFICDQFITFIYGMTLDPLVRLHRTKRKGCWCVRAGSKSSWFILKTLYGSSAYHLDRKKVLAEHAISLGEKVETWRGWYPSSKNLVPR